MAPAKRCAKKHAKARHRHHLQAQERLARDRRQAQQAAETLQQTLDDLGLPDDLVTEIEGRLRSQHKLLGKMVGVMCPPLFGCHTNVELCRVRGWNKNFPLTRARCAAQALLDQAPPTFGMIKLSDFRGKQMVLLEFYHADWGPTCMANLTARRDVHHQCLELGIQGLGISLNHAYSQKSFAASLKLPYPLLSDYPDGRTILAYRVGYYEGQTQRLYARPSFFLIDKAGIVRGFWGQRPVNPDEIWAPDPLFSSEPILDLAQEIVQRP